jgi:hypothetical protein
MFAPCSENQRRPFASKAACGDRARRIRHRVFGDFARLSIELAHQPFRVPVYQCCRPRSAANPCGPDSGVLRGFLHLAGVRIEPAEDVGPLARPPERSVGGPERIVRPLAHVGTSHSLIWTDAGRGRRPPRPTASPGSARPGTPRSLLVSAGSVFVIDCRSCVHPLARVAAGARDHVQRVALAAARRHQLLTGPSGSTTVARLRWAERGPPTPRSRLRPPPERTFAASLERDLRRQLDDPAACPRS